MITKPTEDTRWASSLTNAGASGNPNKLEPTTAFKEYGQPEEEPTDRQGLNYILDAHHKWKEWLAKGMEGLNLKSATTQYPDFESLREFRKTENAGSGVLEWGKDYTSEVYTPVNQGIWCGLGRGVDESNKFLIGLKEFITTDDISRSNYLRVLVDGIEHRIDQVGLLQGITSCWVLLPDAPDGRKTYNTLNGVTTEHATSNEAFEGLVTNGDFRNGNTAWGESPNLTYDYSQGIAVLSNTGGSLHEGLIQTIPTTAGTYRLEFSAKSDTGTGNTQVILAGDNIVGGVIYIDVPPTQTGFKTYTVEFETTGSCDLLLRPSVAGSVLEVAHIAVHPVAEKVVTCRKDLVWIETWEEVINNGYVFPYGNIQNQMTSHHGITLLDYVTDLGQDQGYCGFGEWDSETTGRCVEWKTLSQEEKILWVTDSDNNIYYKSDTDEFYQCRYRIRVVEGRGSNWDDPLLGKFDDNTWLNVRGSNKTTVSDMTDTQQFLRSVEDAGILESITSKLIPLASVQRLNQGVYHPTYNPQGTSRIWTSDGLLSTKSWYESGIKTLTSTASAFDLGTTNVVGQYTSPIGSSVHGDSVSNTTGRSGVYEFYDTVYEGLVEDLRIPATKLDYSRLLFDRVRKAFSGTTRGKSKVPFTKVFSSVAEVESGFVIVNQDNPSAVVAESYGIFNAEYDTLPWIDIVGDPVNIKATFMNGVFGKWVSTLPNGTLQTFNLTNKTLVGTVEKFSTTDKGSSWTVSSTTANLITNTLSETIPASDVNLYYYEPKSCFTSASSSGIIRELNDSVIFTASNDTTLGNRLQLSLIDSIGTADNVSDHINGEVYLNTISYDSDGKLDVNSKPLHNSIESGTPVNQGSMVKLLPSLTEENGLLYVQYHGKEILFDDTSFSLTGDDSYIPVVDNVQIVTDLNGKSVKAFCHRELLPVGIVDYTETNI